ncbi:hypothetical protein [Kosakonia phage 305]|uniref:Uncharacterized protein n=1 Tax=Kosakonia phage 305 TaxID=2863193 RepID=A0AAE7WG35_9CAUD|nr:hypothetical protein PP421_gp114 [Kosakonia phage 305]QYN80265.1 hypothetical protein [Kosakonia phage 305]
MKIIERIAEHGDGHIGVTRSIEYNNGHDNTLLTMDIVNGRAIGASFKFSGMSSFGGGEMKLEELRRFKHLLNSFPEL